MKRNTTPASRRLARCGRCICVYVYMCMAMTYLRCVSKIGNLSTDFIEKLQSKGSGTIPKQKMPVMEREEIFKTTLPCTGIWTAKEYL